MDLFIHHEASPYVRKVLLVCEELSLHPRELRVDMTSQAEMDEYRKINPLGKFPTLRDGELIVRESNAIVIYLAQNSPDGELAGRDPGSTALINQWLFWELAHFAAVVHPLANSIMGFASRPADSEEALLQQFHGHCALLDAELANQPYILGERPSLPDFAIAADLTYAGDAALPLEDYPQLHEWFSRIRDRSSWQVTEDRKNRVLASQR